MRQHTNKRAQLERKYQKVKAQIMEDREKCCAGCKRYGVMISFSHRIPRSRNINLLIDPENIDLMCFACHENVEIGRYDLLDNGQEILDYIERTDIELFNLKTLK